MLETACLARPASTSRVEVEQARDVRDRKLVHARALALLEGVVAQLLLAILQIKDCEVNVTNSALCVNRSWRTVHATHCAARPCRRSSGVQSRPA